MCPERQNDGGCALCTGNQRPGGLLRLPVLVGRILAFVALAFSAAAADAQTFSKPMKLSNTSGSSAPQVVVDSNGHVDVVWEDSACGIWFSGSADSGTTFSAPASVAKASNCSQDERIAVDLQGNINVVWSSLIASSIYFARSTDGGSTFSTPANISQSIPAANYPAIALAGDGSINIGWIGGAPRSLFLSRSEDGGGSFSTTTIWNVPVQPESGASDWRIAARADGSVYVVWTYMSDTAAPACDTFFSRSIDRGVTFANPTNLSHSPRCANVPQMAIDSSGDIDIVWNEGISGLRFSRSTDGGASFSAPTPIPQSGGVADMALDAKGNINIVWNSSSFLSTDVMFSRSVNGGANFSPAKDLGPAGGPHIAIDSQGNINILWQGTYANGHDDIFFTHSTDDGSSFSTPVNVSNNSGQAELAEMAVEANGDIDIVWDDNGGGSSVQDTSVYFRRAVISQPANDFTISAAPVPLITLPGGSATAQVTVTSTGNFNQSVTLSCSKLAPGASCSFDTTSVTPSNSGTHASVTLNIPPTFAPGSFGFTISAVAANTTHTQDVQVTVGGLTGSVAPTAATISVGSSSTFNVSLNSSGGFSGQVNLACGGAPSGIACSFSPAQLNVPVNGSATSTLTVQVSTKPSGSLSLRGGPQALPVATQVLTIVGLVLLLLLPTVIALSRDVQIAHLGSARVARPLAAIVLTIALAAAMVSCGGATTSSRAVSGSGTAATSSGTGSAAGSGSSTGGSGASGGTGSGGNGSGGSSSVTTQVMVRAQSGGATVDIGSVSITVP